MTANPVEVAIDGAIRLKHTAGVAPAIDYGIRHWYC